MQGDGLQDYVGILNVVNNGLGMGGKLAFTATKAGIMLATNLYKLLSFIVKKLVDAPYMKVSGKTSAKVLQTKFQDLQFADIPVYKTIEGKLMELELKNVKVNVKEIQDYMASGNFMKEFTKQCKKDGLLYTEIPNFMTGEPRISFSGQQAKAFEEAKEQMLAKLLGKLKDCGVPADVAEGMVQDCRDRFEGKPIIKNVGEIIDPNMSPAVFDQKMAEYDPSYDPNMFQGKEPNEEKKRAFQNAERENHYNTEKKKNNVTSFVFEDYIQSADKSVLEVVPKEYPNVTVTIPYSEILNGEENIGKNGKIQHTVYVKKDTIFEVKEYTVDAKTRKVDRKKSPMKYQITLEPLWQMLKLKWEENKEKVRDKVTAMLEEKIVDVPEAGKNPTKEITDKLGLPELSSGVKKSEPGFTPPALSKSNGPKPKR